jgi:hypothetical protein
MESRLVTEAFFVSPAKLANKLPDQPHVAERGHKETLKHPSNDVRRIRWFGRARRVPALSRDRTPETDDAGGTGKILPRASWPLGPRGTAGFEAERVIARRLPGRTLGL